VRGYHPPWRSGIPPLLKSPFVKRGIKGDSSKIPFGEGGSSSLKIPLGEGGYRGI